MSRASDFRTPAEYTLNWGDLHKHMTGPGADLDRLDEVVDAAREHLDFVAVFCYPFKWFRKGRDGGIREETVGNRPEFRDWWERVQSASRDHNDPGGFVTFPAYEWHGDRRRWGDHHVLYRREGYPLDDERDLPDLYDTMADRDALVVPHHTGYRVGERGGDWDAHDPDLSPVMEVYSGHGSSEGVSTPVPMADNHSMGPRTSGGTFRDGLAGGHRTGVVASNDGPGLPGAWGNGLVGVWAGELTREGVWEALRERRTYGVTGDRIALWWELDGAPMGSVCEPDAAPTARVSVDCPRPLCRVELVGEDGVERTYTHPEAGYSTDTDVYRTLVEFGWGPTAEYGDFTETVQTWAGTLRADGGTVRRVWPRFVGFGQSCELTDDGCRFDLVTSRDGDAEGFLPEEVSVSYRQGLVVEYTATPETDLVVDLADGDSITLPHASLRDRTHLVPFLDESWDRLEAEFELTRDDIDNEDVVYHTARKVRVHRSVPRTACRTGVEFGDLPSQDYYYVRVSQVDGQYAWASPVWLEG